MSAKCGSCGASIVWTETVTGKSMPVDSEASPDGNVVIGRPDDPRNAPVARVLRKGEMSPGPRFKSHFATCPNAATHRKPAAK